MVGNTYLQKSMKRTVDACAAVPAKYEDSKKSADKSSVWFYYLRATDGNSAKCKKCNKILKTAGSSTSSLWSHLRTKHSIDLKVTPAVLVSDPTPCSSQQNVIHDSQADISKPKKQKMTDFYHKLNSVECVVSKMAALDGLPFKTFCTSEELRKLFLKSGYNLPSSPKTIKNMVIETNENLKSSTIQEIDNLKSNEVKFAVTLDEWTSNRNRRYMNVNIFSPHFKDQTGFKNLGLARISTKGTAQYCLDILRKKLDSYNLSLGKDIICLTTDGATVMTALGQAAKVNQQLCLAHGVQLGIIDVLYKNSTLSETEEQIIRENTSEEPEESEDSDDENGALEKINEEQYKPVEIVVYKATIEKVRKVARMFRKSPTKNDILKTYVLLEEGNKALGLILDCKTRWSSMGEMITRFLRLKDFVSKALIDLKSDIRFSDAEIQNLTELSESLAIIKASVEALCQRDANLITAVTAIKFMLKKLRQDCYSISNQLADSIKIRMIQRLTKLTGILLYLQNPTSYYRDLHTDINKAIALDSDEIRSTIISIIKKNLQ